MRKTEEKGDNRSCSSGGEACGITQEGTIDIAKHEYAAGAQIRMKSAIAEEEDELGRNRYIEKQRISHTDKIIRGDNKMGKIYRDLPREPTQETLYDM